MEDQLGLAAIIDGQFEQQVAFLQKMVQARSTNQFTPNQSPADAPVEQQVAAVIQEHLLSLDLPARLYGVTPQRPNVVCRISGTEPGGQTLILTTHTDTIVPPPQYSRDPFSAEVENGRMYGVGVADAKAQIAGFVYAVLAVLKRYTLKGNLILAFVADEESGACSPYGTRYLLDQGLLDGNAALVGEPGDQKIATGHRGVYRFRVKTEGEAVHTGLREWEQGLKGHNAVIDMAQLATAMTRCVLPYSPSATFPGRKPVLTFPTIIQGGNSVNMVPGWCESYGDVRLLPGTSDSEVKRILTGSLDQAGVPYSFEQVAYVPATEIPENAEIVQVLSSSVEAVTGRTLRRTGGGPACDGWMFISRGIPAVCGYGVECEGVHGPDEWASLASLREVTEVYARTILDYLGFV